MPLAISASRDVNSQTTRGGILDVVKVLYQQKNELWSSDLTDRRIHQGGDLVRRLRMVAELHDMGHSRQPF